MESQYSAEQAVWQRVTAPAAVQWGDLRPLTALAGEQLAALQQLSPILPQKQQRQLQALIQKNKGHYQALLAMARMSGSSSGPLPPAPKGPPAALLTVCFQRSGMLLTEYTARSLDSKFGSVFHAMAQAEEQIGLEILSLLGGIG